HTWREREARSPGIVSRRVRILSDAQAAGPGDEAGMRRGVVYSVGQWAVSTDRERTDPVGAVEVEVEHAVLPDDHIGTVSKCRLSERKHTFVHRGRTGV